MIQSVTYLLRLWAETLTFRLAQLLLVPARIHLRFSHPVNTWLSYEDLIHLNSQYTCIEKSSPAQEITHQQKWARRVAQIADFYHCRKILEVGCGNGFAAYHLVNSRREIHANDIVNNLVDQVKRSPVIFSIGNACQHLPYPSDNFDLVFSINSFEHFDDPQGALQEMIRVLRPGGYLFIAFSPLYYSPWGLHASRRLGMPYPQLLFCASDIQRYVDENQTTLAHTYSDFSDHTKIGPDLNGYSLEQYHQIIKSQNSYLKTIAYVEAVSLDGIDMIYRYPGIIRDKIPSSKNLFISGVKLLSRKIAHQPTPDSKN